MLLHRISTPNRIARFLCMYTCGSSKTIRVYAFTLKDPFRSAAQNFSALLICVVVAAETPCLHRRYGAPRQRTIHASAMNTKESMWRNLLRRNAQTSWDTTPIIQAQCYVVSEKARCGCKPISEQKQCFMSADYTER